MQRLAWLLLLFSVTDACADELIKLREVQAENPRRYALFLEGETLPGWSDTGSLYCANKRNASGYDIEMFEVRADSPLRFAWFSENRSEPNWNRTSQQMFTIPESSAANGQIITLYEFRAESPRRYAFFPGGRAESGWVSAGNPIRLLRCP